MAFGADSELTGKLFHLAMKGDWREVVSIYREHPEVHMSTLTKSGDTALHIAISDGQEDIVEELVNLISEAGQAYQVLKVRNERWNTPLHFAASMGSVRMCQCIASIDNRLIGARNKDLETPFFLAALHGNKDAFLCLQRLCGLELGYQYCRRCDGETILHSAINGEYFDLAFHIIHLYEDIVNYVNERGLSPLHLLASKPEAFISGSHLRWFDKIIYHCTSVDELKNETSHHQPLPEDFEEKKSPQCYPDSFFRLLKSIYCILARCFGATRKSAQKNEGTEDVENPERQHGSREIMKIQEKKKKHIWSVQIMNELVDRSSAYKYNDNGQLFPSCEESQTLPCLFEDQGPQFIATDTISSSINANKEEMNNDIVHDEENRNSDRWGMETPILIAAKNGVIEIVDKILQNFPAAINDMNYEKKNIVLLAVEHRQPHVYQLLLERGKMKDSVFRMVDKDGNSALHLVAKVGPDSPWLIPGAALQMLWEIKWYTFVKNSVPPNFFVRQNNKGNTAVDIFLNTHIELMLSDREWLTNTSQSSMVVATLVATVAFTTSTTVPGGVKEGKGTPTLQNEPAFNAFTFSSLAALFFSVTSVLIFLAILTSRYQHRDICKDLPRKLVVGLTSLFISIASMLTSFCAGHFFVLEDKLKHDALLVYAVACLPVIFFAIVQFPLYCDLISATLQKVPKRSFNYNKDVPF